MVGGILIAAGAVRRGIVTDLLSKPLRIGYLNAIALIVIVTQVPPLLGFSVDADGLFAAIGGIAAGAGSGRIDVVATALGAGAIVVIVVFRAVWGGRIPGVFVAVAGAIILNAALGLDHRIPVGGGVTRGLPAPRL